MDKITRRLFLRNTAAAGAVGATVTAPAIAAQPEMTAKERARYHFAEFSKAMDELTAGANGWVMNGGARGDALLCPVPSAEPWFIAKAVHHVEEPIMPDGRAVSVHVKGGTELRTHMLVSRHREVMRTDY